ncbi:MAG: murein L,D-transpeptidase, partial [Pseudomonadota bacterium]
MSTLAQVANGIRIRLTLALLFIALSVPAHAQVTAFKQAVAEAAASDEAIAAFYQERGYQPIWTGKGAKDRQRRAALIEAASGAGMHGLPAGLYDPAQIKARIKAARGPDALGKLEVYLTSLFLDYARDVQTGILTPSRVDREIVRAVPYRDRQATLVAFAKSSAKGFMKALPPQSGEYTRLMKEKFDMEKLIARGGWGPQVQARSLKPGQ